MIHWSLQYPEGITKYTHIHQCKSQVCHIQHTLDWPQHAGETLLLADPIGAYCDTEYEFLSADTKTDMWVTAAMIMSFYGYIESPSLCCLLVVGRQHNSTTGRRKGHHTKFKTGGCSYRAPTDYRACSSSYSVEDQRSAMFLLYWERNDRRLSTPARARGYSRREHITRGNTYPRVGGTHITVIHQREQISPGRGRGYVFGGTENQGDTYLELQSIEVNTRATRERWLTRACQFAGKHITAFNSLGGTDSAWLGICVRGNRKSGGTHKNTPRNSISNSVFMIWVLILWQNCQSNVQIDNQKLKNNHASGTPNRGSPGPCHRHASHQVLHHFSSPLALSTSGSACDWLVSVIQ